MGIQVMGPDDRSDIQTYDAESWELDRFGDGVTLTLYDKETKPVACYASGAWSTVRQIESKTLRGQLEEALELLGQVDQGTFSNQDSDWSERAQELLDQVNL